MGSAIRVWVAVLVSLLVVSGSARAQAPIGAGCDHPDEPRTVRLLATEMTCMINDVREARDLRRLRVHPQLRRSATSYARRLVRERAWTHFADGSPAVRVHRSGYLEGSRRWMIGEVLGSMRWWDPAGVVRAFLDSPSHRRVLLRPGYRDIGVGAAEGLAESGSPGGYSLAVNLGERRD